MAETRIYFYCLFGEKMYVEKIRFWLSLIVINIVSSTVFFFDLSILCFRPSYFVAYLKLLFFRLQCSPYRHSRFKKVFLKQRFDVCEDDLVYGETPLISLFLIFFHANFKKGSFLIDLGAGRGNVLLAANFLGRKSLGFEIDQSHVDIVSSCLGPLGITIKCQNAQYGDIRGASHIFVAWTTWPFRAREAINEKLLSLEKGSYIISLTWTILMNEFELVHTSNYLFSWGREKVLIYKKK